MKIGSAGHRAGAWLALWLAGFALGCATPVGVNRISPQEANRLLTANLLTTGEPGAAARQFLYRLDLSQRYRDDPAGTIALLHSGLGEADEPDRLFALAESTISIRQERSPACARWWSSDTARAACLPR
jgi:hypothetical protein